MVLKAFPILILVYFKLAFAGSEHLKDDPPRCHGHLQTISCPCKRKHGEQLDVTVRKCADDLNVCHGKAVVTKCRIAYLSLKRQRRDKNSQTLYCQNGTILPSPDSSRSINDARAPDVTIDSLSRNLFTDDTVEFKCTVVSSLAANVTWLFNGVPLAEQKDYRHSYENCRTTFQIRKLLSKDAGNYTCVVQNEIGRAMASSHLTVISNKIKGPYIMYWRLEGKTGSNTAVVGSSLNLTCESQNVEVFHVFKKDGTRVHEGDASHYEMYHIPKDKRNVKVSKLEIKNVTLEDTGNYTCIAWLNHAYGNKTFYLRIVNASQSLEEEQQASSDSHNTSGVIIGIVFGVIGVVVIILLASFCTARKWKWPSSYKTKKTNSNQHDSQVVKRPPEKAYDAKYDVFICYSSKDTSWVKELLAELEKRRFVCCIDFKNFTVGAAIVENITQAIYYSRKTVAVLSPDFVNSQWCSHELQKALTRIHSHQVVPIVYKNCSIPLLLQDRTYLDWENCHVKPYFWEQLENALRRSNDDVMHFDKPIGASPADQ